jgi:enterochelin esterase-like enzyme
MASILPSDAVPAVACAPSRPTAARVCSMEDEVAARWDGEALTFGYADPDRRLTGVRLIQHAGLPLDRLEFGYADGAWTLRTSPPPARRLEYRLELRHRDGGIEVACDPTNPHRVGGAYGDRSVLLRGDYAEPAWLAAPAADGSWRELAIPAPALSSEIWARVWSPAGAGDRILVAHDGPEYDKLGELGQFVAATVHAGRVAPHHLVLLSPGNRKDWYSANPAYARTLAVDVVPRVHAELGKSGPVVGMGASLGALGMLHAQRRFPRTFAGLFLQSGSFFRPVLDPQESGSIWFSRIVRFTGRVVAAASAPRRVPTVMTCGIAEENMANNREMARALARQGVPATLHEHPDAHNFTAWRDALDPYLVDLLGRVWARAGG